jgi:alpha-tubulin suppressor-like RCC1 family protein/tRNA A-37 threonylcarbamoyl transferase component Bud32
MLGDTEANVATTDLESEYEILGELGRGATAVVYRARDRELGREVAIKVIRPKFVDDDETVARLAREARTVAQLQHPNIVTLFAVKRVRDGSLALVMQIVPGRTLREILNERGAWTFERADRVLRDVASALAHAHERGIVHRDVKPENIFIDETTGRALLSDFGVARSLEPDSQLTATGTAIGTPAYMSPEQIDGTELDGRSDLYSLGLVGWEMLTGRRPWEGEGLYSVIYKQKREELQPIDELRPDTPNRLIYLVEGAIRKDPAERWSSAGELVERASTIAPEEGWSRWQADRRKRRRAMVYAASRERGDSVLSAAVETVRFQRDLARARAEGSAAVAVSRTEPAASVESAPARPRRADTATDRPKRSYASAVVVTAVVLAVIGASARIMRGRVESAPETIAPATFADNGGVEVPLSPVPNVSPGTRADSTATLPANADPNADTVVPAAPSGGSDTTGPPQRALPPAATAKAGATDGRTRTAVTDDVAPRAPVVFIPPVSLPPTPTRTTAPVPSTATRAGNPPPAPAAATTGGPAVTFPPERSTVAAGGRHSCALTAGGRAECWGANDQGQLGDGSHEDRMGPAAVAGDLSFSQLSAGQSHTCGITREGDAYCWGNNERGQLGDATTLQRDTPVRVGANGPFKTVRAGFSHSCALSRAGEISCWGSNAYGQIGSGGGLTSQRPVDVAGGVRFGAMAVGWNHTCAITPGGDLYCWGSNSAGQLGDGTRDDRRVPTRVAGSARFIAVAAGSQHTCAVAVGGGVYCWGRNTYGQLATGAGDRSQPARVESDGQFSAVAAGAVHTCATTITGQVYCWGRNTFGQLGDGTTTDRGEPIRVTNVPAVAVLQASGAHTCAGTTTGETYCWGYNVEGQIGDGTRNHRSRPVRVAATAR